MNYDNSNSGVLVSGLCSKRRVFLKLVSSEENLSLNFFHIMKTKVNSFSFLEC